METNHQLEIIYKSFINNKNPFYFFKGVNRYVKYIYKNSELKGIFNKKIEEFNEDYKKERTLNKENKPEHYQVSWFLSNEILSKELISFKRLNQFEKAFDFVSNDVVFNPKTVIPEGKMYEFDRQLEAYDNVAIYNFIDEFKKLKQTNPHYRDSFKESYSSLYKFEHLDKELFRDDINNVHSYLIQNSKEEKRGKNETVKPPCWVRKKEDNYFYEDKLVKIKNPKANYFVIFDVVYHLAPNGDDVKYTDIIESCKTRNLSKTTKRKIQRALSGESASFFKYVKGIDRIISGGIFLFEADPEGKFLTFNNKKN